MSLNCLCVIFTNQKLYPQFLISLAVTRKKSQQQRLYDEYQKYIHGILLSTVYIQTTMECCQQGAPRDVSRDISVKVLGFQRQGVFNTKLQQRCSRSGVQFQTSSYWKRDEICQQSVLCWLQLMAASGNFARFPKLQENGVKGWYQTPLFRWFT